MISFNFSTLSGTDSPLLYDVSQRKKTLWRSQNPLLPKKQQITAWAPHARLYKCWVIKRSEHAEPEFDTALKMLLKQSSSVRNHKVFNRKHLLDEINRSKLYSEYQAFYVFPKVSRQLFWVSTALAHKDYLHPYGTRKIVEKRTSRKSGNLHPPLWG